MVPLVIHFVCVCRLGLRRRSPSHWCDDFYYTGQDVATFLLCLLCRLQALSADFSIADFMYDRRRAMLIILVGLLLHLQAR